MIRSGYVNHAYLSRASRERFPSLIFCCISVASGIAY